MKRHFSSLEVLLIIISSILLICCIGLIVVSWISLRPEGNWITGFNEPLRSQQILLISVNTVCLCAKVPLTQLC